VARFAELGELASVLAATRLVTWEAQDLTIALQAPADPDTLALVMLNARRTGHAIRWCPFRLHAGTGRYDDVVVPEWGPPMQLHDPPPADGLVEVPAAPLPPHPSSAAIGPGSGRQTKGLTGAFALVPGGISPQPAHFDEAARRRIGHLPAATLAQPASAVGCETPCASRFAHAWSHVEAEL
jgi:hypothetical protein